MSLYRIQEALYNKPWCIKPSVHRSMMKQLEAHLRGVNASMPLEDPEEENDVPTPIQDGIQVIPVCGVIGKHLSLMETMCGGCDLDEVAEALKEARDNAEVSAIVMNFNTPGGTVTGVAETAALIAEVSKVKPVYGYADALCASAGMWLASQCTAFYVAPSADVGSIGVWSLYFDQSRAMENEGITANEISAGKFKTIGASWRKMTDEEKAILQADTDKIYNTFKATVKSTRKVSDSVCQGLCYDGETAVSNNLADGIFNDLESLIGFVSQANIYTKGNSNVRS